MKVLILCSGGFSSSLLMEKMKQEAIAQNIPLEITATGSESLEELVDNYEIVLVAPQVRHRLERLSGIAKEHNRPIELIEPVDYGTANAAKVLEQVKVLLPQAEIGR